MAERYIKIQNVIGSGKNGEVLLTDLGLDVESLDRFTDTLSQMIQDGTISPDLVGPGTISSGKYIASTTNIIPYYDSFENYKNVAIRGLSQNISIAEGTNIRAFDGSVSLKLQANAIPAYKYLHSNSDVDSRWIPVLTGGVHTFSFYFYTTAAITGSVDLIDKNETPAASVSINTNIINQWTRVSVTTSSLSLGDRVIIRINLNTADVPIYFDAFQLEAGNTLTDFYKSGTTIIDGGSIATGSINADFITTGTLNAAQANITNINAASITTGYLNAGRIDANTINATMIAANAITADKITANAITSDKITANAITSDKIIANAISAGKIAADAVTANTIAANSITSNKLSSNFGDITNILKIGSGSNIIYLNGVSNTTIPVRIYTGDGVHASTNTGFYLDDDGKFSLKNQLVFTPSGNGEEFAQLNIAGKVRGAFESQTLIPSGRIAASVSQINTTTNITTIITGAHTFLKNESVVIYNTTTNINNLAFTIVNIPNSTSIQINTTGYVVPNATGLTGSVALREVTMGLHPAEGTGTTWEHLAGTGLRLDDKNWWFTNGQWRVGTGSSYLKWDGAKFKISGSGTKTLEMSIGAEDSKNYYSIVNTGSTPTFNAVNTPFYVDASGNFSLGQKLKWNGSSLDLEGAINATSGTIGGFTIGSTVLNAGTGTSAVGLAPGTYPFYAGNATAASAPFRVNATGDLFASNANIAGAINATSGTIGGFTIGPTVLNAGTGTSAVGLSSGEYTFYAGNTTAASAPFRVANNGAITATNAVISGNISATSGSIGGFTIGTTSLNNSDNTVGMSPGLAAGSSNYSFWTGNSNPALAPFSVTNTGALNATSGTIGAWTITTNAINAADAGITVAGSAGTNVVRFFAGANWANRNTAEFRVSGTGFLTATNANISGTITANAGSIAGWTLNTTHITGTNISLNSAGRLQFNTAYLYSAGGGITHNTTISYFTGGVTIDGVLSVNNTVFPDQIGTSGVRCGTIYHTNLDASGTLTAVAAYSRAVTANTPRTMVINSTGAIGTTASTRRFKTNIEPYDFNYNALMNLPIVSFEFLPEKGGDGSRTQGTIAEEAEALGLSEFIGYDEYGLPDYFAYEKLPIALVQVAQKQHKYITQLEARIASLEAKINATS